MKRWLVSLRRWLVRRGVPGWRPFEWLMTAQEETELLEGPEEADGKQYRPRGILSQVESKDASQELL
jgi:hypothetical protein